VHPANEFIDLAQNAQARERMLCEMGLLQTDEHPHIEMLTGGVSSSIFRVDLRQGSVCVKQGLPRLRVQKDWRVPTTRVLAEIDWLTVAHEVIPGHVPRILGADRDLGAFVMEFVAGYKNWKAELLAGRVDYATGVLVADVLGRFHAATAAHEDLKARFACDANFFALRLEPYLIESARENADLARQLIDLVHEAQHTAVALIHGDVSPKNILVGESGPVLIPPSTWGSC
jgi:5-methylthioribose kinase